MRNHTATHLLHAALRNVLGKHVTQAGSYVGPDRLRFVFTHGRAMSPVELSEVVRIVNEKALENLPVVTYVDLPVAEAKKMGAMALFGEKYGNTVRMVQVGIEAPDAASFSRELCGGTHVRSTGEIGLFKIVSESSAASGVRRIEALTGEGAYQWVLDQERVIREVAGKLKAAPKDLVAAIDRAQETQRDLKQKLEKARSQGSAVDGAQIKPVGPVELAVQKLTDADPGEASRAADRLAENQPNRVVLVGLAGEGKVTFVSKVGAEAAKKGAHAGNLVRELAKITGGGGGGRPDFATAGGRQPEKLDEALQAAEAALAGMLS
jgi:alanyl-tRNA synthetase